jgi:transcriptional regulator with XRE-family HTH domain
MLHEQIRKARLDAGLTQMGLSRAAGIQRSLLQNLEDGRNITIDTLRKVIAHLPALRSLNLDGIALFPDTMDELRQEAMDMMASAQRILAILDRVEAGSPATVPAADATRAR